jgi:branched-subunit amino acid aminotransferase/4-amino-4-deoxychorismate lyase
MALRRLQESARRAGLDTMTMDEIDEVIQESRRERRARDAKGNK